MEFDGVRCFIQGMHLITFSFTSHRTMKFLFHVKQMVGKESVTSMETTFYHLKILHVVNVSMALSLMDLLVLMSQDAHVKSMELSDFLMKNGLMREINA